MKEHKIKFIDGISIGNLQKLIIKNNIPDYAEINVMYDKEDGEIIFIHWNKLNF